MLCIQELDSFGYTPLLIFLKPSSLSPYLCVIKYLVFLKKKKKKKRFIVASKKRTKKKKKKKRHVIMSIFLKPHSLSPYLCVIKYLVFLKKKKKKKSL